MTKTKTQLHRLIMRRVWYVFLLSLFVNRGTIAGFIFGASIMWLAQLVFVAAIFDNLLATQLGSVPTYLYNTVILSFKHGEVLQVVLASLIFTSFVYLLQILHSQALWGKREWRSV